MLEGEESCTQVKGAAPAVEFCSMQTTQQIASNLDIDTDISRHVKVIARSATHRFGPDIGVEYYDGHLRFVLSGTI